MKRKQKKAMAWCLSAALLVSTGIGLDTMPESKAATDYGLQNPRVRMQTRDCIYFGNYWQEDTNGDGVANQKDEKTPIKWQILEEKDGELLLLADSVLDCKKYNEKYEDVTWETSTIRTWLNDDFYRIAFSEEEKTAVNESTVVNEDSPVYETEGGADTRDYVFLLSLSEITNPAYGFQGDGFSDQVRHGKATAYAKEQGRIASNEDTSCWWLRSPGGGSNYATRVNDNGSVHSYGANVCGTMYVTDGGIYYYGDGVRPALRVNAANAAILSALQTKEIREVALSQSTWDTVTFGTYNGVPITWRVLSVQGDDAFLLADRILLKKFYHDVDENVTWETSTVRTWLNNEFYMEAFSKEGQEAIRQTTIKNEDNSLTEGGNDTTDKIYLLSLSDIVNPSYGFPTAYECNSSTREAVPTNREGTSCWWLRSPGYSRDSASSVDDDGYVDYIGYGSNVDDYNNSGVRPALHLNLSSFVWSKGGEVTSDDKKSAITDTLPDETPNGIPDGIPVATPPVTPGTGDSAGNQQPGGSNGDTNPGGSTGSNTNTNGNAGTENNANGNGNTGTNSITQSGGNGAGSASTVTAPAKVKSLTVKNKKKKTVTVSYKNVKGAAGYQFQYALNKKFTKGKKSKTVKKTSVTVKNLKKKKTYYFRVRAYKQSGKKKVYGKWSSVKKLKVKK